MQGVCLLGYVEFGSFATTRLMGKRLSSLKLLLKTVLIKPFKLINAFVDIEWPLHWCFYCALFQHFFLRHTAWVGQIIISLVVLQLLAVALQLHLFSYYFLEGFLVFVLFATPFI